MIWPFNVFRSSRYVKPSEIPVNIIGAAVVGVISGPVLGVFFEWLTGHNVAQMFSSPGPIIGACASGAIFSTSFYLTCGVPQVLLTSFINNLPVRMIRPVRVLIGALGAVLGYSLAVYGMALFLGVHIISTQDLGRVLVIEAILGAIISLIIGTFVGLKMQVEHAQAIIREKELSTAKAQALALQ